MAGVPLLFLRSALDPINVPKLALLMAGLSVVVALRIAEVLQGEPTDGLRRLVIPAAAIVTPLILAWLFSSYKGWSLFGQYPRFTGLVPYLVVVLFGVMLADAFGGRALQIAWALLIAGAIAGAYALIQFVRLDPLDWTVRGAETDVVASTLGNSNFVGAFLGMVVVVGAAVVVADPGNRRWSIAFLALTGIGWVVARSEGGWAGAFAGGAVAAGMYLSTRWKRARIVGFIVGGAVLVAVIGSVLVAIAQGPDSSLPDTARRRADWWQGAVAMTADSPIVGMGPSTFALEHARYRTLNDALQVGNDVTDDPHSIFLSFLSGAGIVGAVGLVVAIAWIVREGARVDPDNVIGAGFFGAFVAYLVPASISIDTVAIRAAMWTVVAGIVASSIQLRRTTRSRSARKKGRARPAPIRNLPAVVIVYLVAGVAFWYSGRFLLADTSARSSAVAFADGNVTIGQQAFGTAIARRDEVRYREQYGTDTGRLAVALADEGEEEPARDLLGESRAAFRFVEEVPDTGAILTFAGIQRGVTEIDPVALDNALELYLRATRLDPNNPVVAEEAAAVAIELEEYEAVVDVIQGHPAIEERPGLNGYLALAYAHLGREDEARVLAEEVLRELEFHGPAEDALELLKQN
ncbi:MAG: O-antigen ligase family protein [Actinomycetota bacterium]